MDEDQRAVKCRTTNQLKSKPVVNPKTRKCRLIKDTCDNMKNGYLMSVLSAK